MEGLLGLALIAGLFVAYAMEQRAKRRAHDRVMSQPAVPEPALPAAPLPAPAAAEAASDANAGSAAPAAAQPVSRGSPNWGAPIILTGLLLAAATHRDSWWGILWQVLFFAFLALAAYSTFSPKEIADEQRRRPGTTRGDIFLHTGVPYLLIPLVAWVLAIPMGYGGAAILPAIPWILLALLGMVIALVQSFK